MTWTIHKKARGSVVYKHMPNPLLSRCCKYHFVSNIYHSNAVCVFFCFRNKTWQIPLEFKKKKTLWFVEILCLWNSGKRQKGNIIVNESPALRIQHLFRRNTIPFYRQRRFSKWLKMFSLSFLVRNISVTTPCLSSPSCKEGNDWVNWV